MNYFYLDDQNQEIGPVSLENLKAFRMTGVIQDHTLVRPDNSGTWTPCVTVVGAGGTPSGSQLQADATKVVEKTWADAKEALAILATNPVGGLAPAYQKLGQQRAGAVGIFFMCASVIAGAFAGRHMLSGLSELSFGMLSGGDSAGSFFKLLLNSAVVPVAAVCALAAARLVNQKGGTVQGDLFVAGTMSLVQAAGLIVASILGGKNVEVLGFVALLVVCITVLQIFAGLTRISELSEQRATLAVPIVTVLAAWLSTVIWRATM